MSFCDVVAFFHLVRPRHLPSQTLAKSRSHISIGRWRTAGLTHTSETNMLVKDVFTPINLMSISKRDWKDERSAASWGHTSVFLSDSNLKMTNINLFKPFAHILWSKNNIAILASDKDISWIPTPPSSPFHHDIPLSELLPLSTHPNCSGIVCFWNG